MKSSPVFNKVQHVDIFYLNMCKFYRKWTGKWEMEREIDGGGVHDCSFGEPSRQQVTFQAFLCIRYITIETK
jgi:hypothetical protein